MAGGETALRTNLGCGRHRGWLGLDDSVLLARALKLAGVDVIDCSSGGFGEETRSANVPRGLGFQVPFAQRIRRDAQVLTQAVGVILHARHAEAILQDGSADLIGVGREALFDPSRAVHAAVELGHDEEVGTWHYRHAGWLDKRAPLIRKLREDAAKISAVE